MEMDLRLSGVWKATSEDVELQNLFIAQLKNWKEFQYEHAGNISTNARAGAFFLRNNKEWLNYYE